MDQTQTTLTTLSLLESRLARVEQLLYGPAASHPPAQREPAVRRMKELERRFATVVSRIRVYAELLKIYRSQPDLFHAAAAPEPPSQLSPDTVRSMVLASASSYHATLSSLTAVKDSPVPDPSQSAALIAVADRIKAMQATQLAQAAEMAELRRRSEALVRSWYEGGVLARSQFMADAEGRVERLERQMRRRERAKEEEKEL